MTPMNHQSQMMMSRMNRITTMKANDECMSEYDFLTEDVIRNFKLLFLFPYFTNL
jgi:hypothetical protein